jgi:hypothetical protein
LSPRSPASCAAGRRAKRTIFALPNLARSAERSATNIRFLSVGSITANCTVTGTRPHGGQMLASTRCPSRSNCGGYRAQAIPDWSVGSIVHYPIRCGSPGVGTLIRTAHRRARISVNATSSCARTLVSRASWRNQRRWSSRPILDRHSQRRLNLTPRPRHSF